MRERTFLMKDTKVEEFKKWAADNGTTQKIHSTSMHLAQMFPS